MDRYIDRWRASARCRSRKGGCFCLAFLSGPACSLTFVHLSCAFFSAGDSLRGSEGGDDPVGKPHRAQISQFELFELIL